MYKFTLKKKTVKRNQVTAIHIIAALILIIMGFVTVVTPFSMNIFNAGKENTKQIEFGMVNYGGLIITIIGIIILIISIFFNRKYIQKKNNLIIRIVEIICFSIILIYSLVQQYYLPAIYAAVTLIGIILAYYLENADQRTILINISNTGVQMKSKIKESIWNWNQLEHFILKHNVITLHTTDKKMYQFIIDNTSINQQDVNSFASEKIKSEEHNRKYDNW